jgi:hypothetical protein
MIYKRPIMTTLTRRQRHGSGIALVLVMVCLATVAILATNYLARQSTAMGVADNIEHHPPARQMAESGFSTALRYVEADSNWRRDHTHGRWSEFTEFADGIFQVKFEDPDDADLEDDHSDPFRLTARGQFEGATARRSAMIHPNPNAGGGAAVTNEIQLDHNSVIDSFDSSEGPYGRQNTGDEALISTNSAGEAKIEVNSPAAQIRGDALAGPDAEPEKAIRTERPENITGRRDKLPAPIRVRREKPPELGPSEDDYSATQPDTLEQDHHVDKFTVSQHTELLVRDDVVIHAEERVRFANNSRVIIENDASLTIYAEGSVTVENRAKLNTSSADPEKLAIHGQNGHPVTLHSRAEAYGTVNAPGSEMSLQNNADFYGRYRGENLRLRDNAGFHQDLAISASEPQPQYEVD